MATLADLKDVQIDFLYSTITKDNRFLSIKGNRVEFSDEQNTEWVFEKDENDDIYYIRNLHAGKNEPKYLGSANTNNIVFLYVSKCKFARWSILQDEDTLYSMRYCGETGNRQLHTIVISRYKEDLDWIEPYCDEVIVYNKGPLIRDSVFKEIRNIDNVGREGHTYLHHILVDYEKLSDRVTFLQGESLSHNETLLFGIENTEKLLPAQSLSYRYLIKYNVPPEDYLDRIKVVTDFGLEYTDQPLTKNCYVEYFDKGILSLISRYRRKYNIRNNTSVTQHFLSMCGIHNVIVPEYFEFWQSALFSVSKEDILHNHPDIYMKLIHGLLRVHGQGGDEGYILERLWKLIFNFEYIIQTENPLVDSHIRANNRIKSGFFLKSRNFQLPHSTNNLEEDEERVMMMPGPFMRPNKVVPLEFNKNQTPFVEKRVELPEIRIKKLFSSPELILHNPVIIEKPFIEQKPGNIPKVFKSDFIKINKHDPAVSMKILRNVNVANIKTFKPILQNRRIIKAESRIIEIEHRAAKVQPSFLINKQVLKINVVRHVPTQVNNIAKREKRVRNKELINIPPSIPVRIPIQISPLFIFRKKQDVSNIEKEKEKQPTVIKKTKHIPQIIVNNNPKNIKVSNSQGFVSDIFENNVILPRVHEYRVALVLRGHIRSGFDNDKLYLFVKALCDLYDVDIYIHTWHILQNSISYRKMKQINTVVTSGKILEYFKEIPVKKIMIQNDFKIKLIGNLSGKICKTNVPTIGWKNMWYGINAIVNQVPNDVYSTVIQTRFDYFNLLKVLSKPMPEALQTVENSLNSEKIIFAIDSESVGVDNFYCGNIILMKQLVKEFNTNLDEICLKYQEARTQEKLVWYVYHELIDAPVIPTLDPISKLKKMVNFFRR